uniref:Uncharacterized protein LOC114342117 n=1 Tax=Diabrotica virgifera virgifera TaxID=50390 RepID=A0A6P7GY44_DIAVI
MDFDVPKVQFDPVPANEEYKPITGEENFNGNPFNVPNPTYKRKTTTSTTTTSTTAATTSDPTRHYFVERKPQGLRRKTTTTTTTTVSPSVSTHRQRSRKPMRHRTTTATTQRHPNHRYEDEHANEVPTSSSSTMFPSNGINIVQPPSLPPKIINEDLLGAHDEKKEVYIEKDVPVSFIPVKDIDLSVGDDKEQDDNVPLIVDFPEDLKGVLTDLNMESALKQKTKKHNKSKTKPTQKPTQKPTGEIGDEQLNNLLATLKLLAAQQTSTTTTTTVIPEYVQAESQQQSTKSKHVFNPSENLSATKDEIEKLNKLSNVIKQLEHLNRTITDEDLQKIDTDTLKVLVQSLNNSLADFEGHPLSLDEQDAPDPLKLEEELMKNEVKREETTTSTTEAPSSTEDTTASD